MTPSCSNQSLSNPQNGATKTSPALLKILVCVRRVPDTATRIKIASSGRSVDTTNVEYVINPYEEYALEAGVQLEEKHGGEVTILTMGPEKSSQVSLKGLALGTDRSVHLKGDRFHEH